MTREELAKANTLLTEINDTQVDIDTIKAWKESKTLECPHIRVINAPEGMQDIYLRVGDFQAVLDVLVDVLQERLSDLENEFNAL